MKVKLFRSILALSLVLGLLSGMLIAAPVTAATLTTWYVSYLGGTAIDYGVGVAVDNSGNIYMTGYTTSTDLPITAGAYQTTNAGDNDAYVAKFNSSGNLVYSSYLGGSGAETVNGIAVDDAGNIYITGYTASTNFPTTAGAYQATNAGGIDAFVAKFSSSGDLVYSTYLGGSGADYVFSRIAVDDTGSIYITGSTASTNFSTTAGAYQATNAGGAADAFVAKFSSSGDLVYSTYLGGSDGGDYGYGIGVDDTGNICITGYTSSTNFPTTPDAYQATSAASSNAFVAKFSSSGDLVYSTYFEGSGSDYGYGIAVDSTGNMYIAGRTASTNFPTTAGAYQTTIGGGQDGYVAKFNSSGNLVYSTYLGGSGTDYAYAIAVDNTGDIYITGQTDSANFPTTAGAYQTARAGGIDAFVTKFSSSGDLIYSTYLGGTGATDYGKGIAVDNTGDIYIAGRTNSANFPTTAGAYQTTYGGGTYDAFFASMKTPEEPIAAFTSDVQSGDAPLTVHFTDQSTNTPTSWAWDFNNDGTVDSTVQNPSYIYAADTYTVKLTATNAFGSDDEVKTNYITVTVAGSSSSLTLNANVVLPMVGIQLDRSSIDYGDIKPGHDSAVETVRVTNTGNLAADVTLEVQGNGTDAQSFYEQSLWVNSALYNSSTVLATIAETLYSDVATQLKVPPAWDKTGAQQAVFIFWAEESG